jgi:hypothetical protein
MKLLKIFSYFKLPTVPVHDPQKSVSFAVRKVTKGSLSIQRGKYSTKSELSKRKKKILSYNI